MKEEVEARIGSATRMIGGMSKAVMRRRELSKGTNLKVVNATIMPSLLYGCEVWSLTKQHESKVQATQNNVLRRIQGVSRKERRRSEDTRQRLGQESVSNVIRRRQGNWKCRLNEMNSDRETLKLMKVKSRLPDEKKEWCIRSLAATVIMCTQGNRREV